MSQSLPPAALRGEVLGQCCYSIAVLENVMASLALLQGYFAPAAERDLCGTASGVVRVLSKSWTDLRNVRDGLHGLTGKGGIRHA